MPESTTVAGPVRVASAISRTGAVSVDVKYSVSRLSDLGEHEADDDGAEALPPGVELVVADVAEGDDRGADDGEHAGGDEAPVDGRHRRLVLVGGPHREHADDRREHADGPGREREDETDARLLGSFGPIEWNAATPRMIDATRVTS